LCAQLAAERVRRNVVDERLRAVDLDDGNQLAVAIFELLGHRDVDLSQVEAELVAQPVQGRSGALAQVAAGRVIEDDLGRYG
jgi:hypothetical protein